MQGDPSLFIEGSRAKPGIAVAETFVWTKKHSPFSI